MKHTTHRLVPVEPTEAQQPIGWSVTYNGQHVGNFYAHKETAIVRKIEADKSYPDDVRTVEPLFARPAPQPEAQESEAKLKKEPIFWYRPLSNGLYEGPIHNAQIENVRKESGVWVPLITAQEENP